MITPVAAGCGYELYDLEFVKEGPDWYLRIYIDKSEGGVTIDDCEIVSRAVEKLMDEEDPIDRSYILEVSSPGIDRALKKDADFDRYAGLAVDVRLYKPIGGAKVHTGELVGLIEGDVVILTHEGAQKKFQRQDVALCRLNAGL